MFTFGVFPPGNARQRQGLRILKFVSTENSAVSAYSSKPEQSFIIAWLVGYFATASTLLRIANIICCGAFDLFVEMFKANLFLSAAAICAVQFSSSRVNYGKHQN